MTIRYGTLDGVKSELKSSDAGNNAITTAQEARLFYYLLYVSKRIDQLAGYEFVPRIETRDFLVTLDRVNSELNTFYMGKPLLALSAVTVGTTALTLTTNVVTYPSNAQYPYMHLRLKGWTRRWYDYCTEDYDPLFVSIAGIWGYRSRYATEGWVKYDDVTTSDITASQTTVVVADADGSDPFGATPRFSPGQLLRIGTEYCEVTAVNTGTNTLTLRRGVNGSTAAAHTVGDDIDVWQVEEDIRRVVERQATMLFARRGAFQTAEITDIGTIVYPADMLAELYAVVGMYQYT